MPEYYLGLKSKCIIRFRLQPLNYSSLFYHVPDVIKLISESMSSACKMGRVQKLQTVLLFLFKQYEVNSKPHVILVIIKI